MLADRRSRHSQRRRARHPGRQLFRLRRLSFQQRLPDLRLRGRLTCTYSTNTEPLAQEVGGTSVATPAMAGVMALINQKTGSAQGNPNAELYKLAAQQTYSNCSAETVTTSNSCYFNDIDRARTPCPATTALT